MGGGWGENDGGVKTETKSKTDRDSECRKGEAREERIKRPRLRDRERGTESKRGSK